MANGESLNWDFTGNVIGSTSTDTANVVDPGVVNTDGSVVIGSTDTSIFSNPDLTTSTNLGSQNYLSPNNTYYSGDVTDIAGGQSIMGVGEVSASGSVKTPSATPDTPTTESSTWAKNLQAGASVIGATASVANAYLGFKNYELAKKQYAFQKASTNRNIKNQGTLINQDLDRRARVAAALAGSTLSKKEKEAYLASVKHVDTSAIKD